MAKKKHSNGNGLQNAMVVAQVMERMAGDPLPEPRHEAFAQEMAKGTVTAFHAYKKVYECSDDCARAASYRLLDNVGIMKRVAELQLVGAVLASVHFGELIAFHALVIRTPIKEIDENHPLAQEVRRKRLIEGSGDEAEVYEVEQIKMVSKMDSARELAKLLKFYPMEGDEEKPAGEVRTLSIKDMLKNASGTYKQELIHELQEALKEEEKAQ